MSSSALPIAVGPGEGATIQGPAGGPLAFKVRGEHTNGTLTALENAIAPGDRPPLHTHANQDEAWYVLEGELRFRLGAELRGAPAGTSFSFPVVRRTAFKTLVGGRPGFSCCSHPRGWSVSSTGSHRCRTAPTRLRLSTTSAARWAWRSSGRHSQCQIPWRHTPNVSLCLATAAAPSRQPAGSTRRAS